MIILLVDFDLRKIHSLESRRVPETTTEVLKAISHPVRRRLLRALDKHKYARATELAEELGISVGSVSFHLRTLGKAGLIEEAPEHARDRRDRVWKASERHISIASPGPELEDHRLSSALIGVQFEEHQLLMRRLADFTADLTQSDADEPAHGALINMGLHASHERMAALLDEIADLVKAARAEVEEVSSDTPFWDLSVIAVDEHVPADSSVEP